eukprot:1161653-Pelagomonas_calceolata.AAC.8
MSFCAPRHTCYSTGPAQSPRRSSSHIGAPPVRCQVSPFGSAAACRSHASHPGAAPHSHPWCPSSAKSRASLRPRGKERKQTGNQEQGIFKNATKGKETDSQLGAWQVSECKGNEETDRRLITLYPKELEKRKATVNQEQDILERVSKGKEAGNR